MDIQQSAATGAVPSIVHLRNIVALQDARSEGGRFAQALLEAERRYTEMSEGVRQQLLAKIEGIF